MEENSIKLNKTKVSIITLITLLICFANLAFLFYLSSKVSDIQHLIRSDYDNSDVIRAVENAESNIIGSIEDAESSLERTIIIWN